MDRIYSALIPQAPRKTRGTIASTLAKFPAPILRFALERRTRIRPLAAGEKYNAASSALRRLSIDVDAWPAPPAGLFVVEERTVYLRSLSAMTVAHEFGHALDCALGGGIYRSGIDPEWRRIFANAKSWVTPYAATALDEAFAEALRAMVGANDPPSPWPAATPQRLRYVDPAAYAYVAAVLAQFETAGSQMPLVLTE